MGAKSHHVCHGMKSHNGRINSLLGEQVRDHMLPLLSHNIRAILVSKITRAKSALLATKIVLSFSPSFPILSHSFFNNRG